MVIFYSYVRLPEGILWFKQQHLKIQSTRCYCNGMFQWKNDSTDGRTVALVVGIYQSRKYDKICINYTVGRYAVNITIASKSSSLPSHSHPSHSSVTRPDSSAAFCRPAAATPCRTLKGSRGCGKRWLKGEGKTHGKPTTFGGLEHVRMCFIQMFP